MPGNKKASLHLDGFFHPGSRSIQGRLLNPCSCGIGIYPAQNPPGETQTPPKDGVWVLGDIPAWLGQVISLNTERGVALHSQKTAGNLQIKPGGRFSSPLPKNLWRSNMQPQSIKSQLNIPFIPGSLQGLLLFPSKRWSSEGLETKKELFPWDWEWRNCGIIPTLIPVQHLQCPRRTFTTQSLIIPSLYPFCEEHF